MSNNIRIIGRLDVKGPNLVKGIKLEGLRAFGDPSKFAELYYENNIDEIFYQDVVASLYNRNNLFDIVEKTTKNVFIPVTVSGGLKSLDDFTKALESGADKIAFNTAAIKNPDLINKAAEKFGSSTIIISIEVIKYENEYLAFTDNGREFTGKNAINWAREVEKRGAGEILLTSVDKDGTGEGFDLELIKKISKEIKIPLIAHGGGGKKEHLLEAVQSGANALALASILHYNLILNNKKNSLLINQNELEGNFEFIKKNFSYKAFGNENIKSLKDFLHSKKLEVRIDK
jgi:cyclase